MPNLHRPPDTRQFCLCHVRRCELSLETVWQSLNSQPIDHTRRVAFSEEVQVQSQAYATAHSVFTCLSFAWRTPSLRVGGRAARRGCRTGLRRGGGGRQAGAAVLSCLVWRCESALKRTAHSNTVLIRQRPRRLYSRATSHTHRHTHESKTFN